MKIRDIINAKGSVFTIEPSKTVREAIKRLVEWNIGALPVCVEPGKLLGIITERDVLRLCARDDLQATSALRVEEVMTKDLVIGLLDDDVDYVMSVMTQRRIRHLPVLEAGQLVQIISIGDVVKARHDSTETEIRFLRDYIAGAPA